MAEILTNKAEIWSEHLGIYCPQDLLLIFQLAVEKVVQIGAQRGPSASPEDLRLSSLADPSSEWLYGGWKG